MAKAASVSLTDEPKIALEGRVTAMPEQYLPQAKKEFPMKKLVIIGSVVILLVVIVAVSLLLLNPSQPAAVPQPPIVDDLSAPAVVVQDEPIEEPQAPDIEEEPVVEEPPEEETSLILIPTVGLIEFEVDVDTDQDGLTDIEELLFGTSAAVPDTDSDSFLDGAEIISLYDPGTPGALLEVSPQIKIVSNELKGYQLLIPAAWSGLADDPTGNSFVIKPTDGSESMTITVYNNDDRLPIVQWYLEADPSASLAQFTNFKNEAGWTGVQSKDKTLVLATLGETGPGARALVFVIHYDPGVQALIRFPSIWEMMLNSLAVFEPEDD